MTTHN